MTTNRLLTLIAKFLKGFSLNYFRHIPIGYYLLDTDQLDIHWILFNCLSFSLSSTVPIACQPHAQTAHLFGCACSSLSYLETVLSSGEHIRLNNGCSFTLVCV